eukprot:1668588-Prymnesium_polylepis.2
MVRRSTGISGRAPGYWRTPQAPCRVSASLQMRSTTRLERITCSKSAHLRGGLHRSLETIVPMLLVRFFMCRRAGVFLFGQKHHLFVSPCAREPRHAGHALFYYYMDVGRGMLACWSDQMVQHTPGPEFDRDTDTRSAALSAKDMMKWRWLCAT